MRMNFSKKKGKLPKLGDKKKGIPFFKGKFLCLKIAQTIDRINIMYGHNTHQFYFYQIHHSFSSLADVFSKMK